jgi:uncharacterized protein (DUF2336 family)
LVVLSTAYVLKGQMLETIEQRHATEYAYQSALADWQVVNARRKETLAAMTQADWRLAVYSQ